VKDCSVETIKYKKSMIREISQYDTMKNITEQKIVLNRSAILVLVQRSVMRRCKFD
jgi:hypothetical protein